MATYLIYKIILFIFIFIIAGCLVVMVSTITYFYMKGYDFEESCERSEFEVARFISKKILRKH